MGEPRLRVAERPEDQQLLRGVGDVVLAADDVADLHVRVVDHDREVVERRTVGPDDDEVAAEVGHVDLDAAADDVVERHDAGPDPEAERAATAVRLAGGTLVRRQRRAASDVPGRQPGGLLRRAGRRRAPSGVQ